MRKILIYLFICFTINLFSNENNDYIWIECHGKTDEQVIEKLASHPNPKNVREIALLSHIFDNNITEKPLQYISDHFLNIRILSVYCLNANNEQFNSTSLYFPSVERLYIGNICSQPIALAAACPHLKDLTIFSSSQSHGSYDELVEIFLVNCPLLNRLEVSGDWPKSSHPVLTDHCLQALTLYGKNVHTVFTQDSVAFSREAIKSFLSEPHSKMFFWIPQNIDSSPISVEEVVQLSYPYRNFLFYGLLENRTMIIKKEDGGQTLIESIVDD